MGCIEMNWIWYWFLVEMGVVDELIICNRRVVYKFNLYIVCLILFRNVESFNFKKKVGYFF